MNCQIPSHAIVALATAYAKAPLAIIRMTGSNCFALLRPLLSVKENILTMPIPRYATLCKFVHPKTHTIIDTGLVTLFKGPYSYTGEDSAEISIHGSIAGIERMLSAMRDAGFEDALPGEFTKRAFLHGKLDLTQAEAVHAIIESHNAQAHAHAVHQLSGALSLSINTIKKEISRLVAICAVSLDYPDDEIQEDTTISLRRVDEIIQALEKLSSSYQFSTLQQEGVSVVLGGKTNAGKSSLFNALVKEERAIVSAEHGTTRDFLEKQIDVHGIPMRLFDTAGLRETYQTVEKSGIARSYKLLSHANVALYVIDATAGWMQEDSTALARMREDALDSNIIIIWNKIDVVKDFLYKETFPHTEVENIFQIDVSATQYTNIAELQNMLFNVITKNIEIPKITDAIINSKRQHQHIIACLDAMSYVRKNIKSNTPLDMISLDLDIALKALGAITGEVATEDILDIMFSEFCVGK